MRFNTHARSHPPQLVFPLGGIKAKKGHPVGKPTPSWNAHATPI
jgi:hypothetical protein